VLRRRAWLVPVALLIDAGLGAPAGAQTSAAESAPDRPVRVVELIVVGGSAEAVGLIGTVTELLGGIGLATEAHAVATPAEVLKITRGTAVARVEVDLRSGGEATIVTESRDQAPSHRTLRRDPSPTVAREELAQAIESAVQAELAAGRPPAADGVGPGSGEARPAPVPPAPVQTPAPVETSVAPPTAAAAPADAAPTPAPLLSQEPSVTPPASRSPVALDISALSGVGGFATGAGAVTDVGGEVAIAWRRGWRVSVALSARAILPFDASAESVTGHASAVATRALVGMALLRRSWIALTPGVGGGADVLSVQPQSGTLAPSALEGGSTRADPIVTAFVATRLALSTGVALTLVLAGDLDLAAPRYVVAQGSAVDPVMTPWTVRPSLLVGFTFTAFGEPLFAGQGGS
jgi:hypothetical protein